jgi:hypothetical protein
MASNQRHDDDLSSTHPTDINRIPASKKLVIPAHTLAPTGVLPHLNYADQIAALVRFYPDLAIEVPTDVLTKKNVAAIRKGNDFAIEFEDTDRGVTRIKRHK